MSGLETELMGLRQAMQAVQHEHDRVAMEVGRLNTALEAIRVEKDDMAREHSRAFGALAADRDGVQASLDATALQLQHSKDELTGLQTSWSWRLTAPLRWIHDRMR